MPEFTDLIQKKCGDLHELTTSAFLSPLVFWLALPK
jgi:hypothetical protein